MSLCLSPLQYIPIIRQGDDLAEFVVNALPQNNLVLEDRDILVFAQKIVSKSEGRIARLADVTAGAEADAMAAATGRPAALMQLMLDESADVVRTTPAVVIARHRTGHVAANAGIDASNVEGGAEDTVLLWPVDPDNSARAIRAELRDLSGVAPAVDEMEGPSH